MNIYYGKEFFDFLNYENTWFKIISYLKMYKNENKKEYLAIPDFKTSEKFWKL
ncbi:hypothetical protein [Mycoplasmopsis columbina]|uniref:Uncharacterized protein n=1 Tax=Mycoplasmopsis columbina SF7 TaxID=1037410 RepID=F9UKE2_9BACT|nr:hypothetical protein [Mycoplasmopsis columbina]EGV00147.1 hypothetical protein MCSF7_01766 [Mycoplasmopsis columbina SF7]